MPRKRRTSFLEDLVSLASMLPWWLSLILAPISFAFFHILAGMKASGSSPAETVTHALWTGITVAAQFVAPVVFLIAAAASAMRPVKPKRVSVLSGTPAPVESEPPVAHAPDIPDDNLYDAWKEVSKTESSPPAIDTTRWSKELLNVLEWKRFEHVCAAYFENLGFKAKVAREGADGGVDIHLYPAGSDNPGIVVQCKAWKTYPVGIKPIRELLGVMADAHITEGIFVTTSRYTNEAREFAEGNNLHLIDGDDFLRKIGDTSPEQKRVLLELATAGDFTTPTCPSCGIKMVARVAKKTGDTFWGCVRFPGCRRTFPRDSD